MGANEKHAATYHGGAGALVTEAVCERYMHDRHATDGIEPVRARAEFNRWLETVRAEAKAEALREAADEVLGYDPRVSLRGIYAALKFRANQYKENLS